MARLRGRNLLINVGFSDATTASVALSPFALSLLGGGIPASFADNNSSGLSLRSHA